MSQRRVLIMLALVAAPLVAAPLVFSTAAPAGAQTGDEHIARYQVALRIEKSGVLLVKEAIAYDFGGAEHHGIYRDVPVRYPYDASRDRLAHLEVVSITASDGAPDAYSVSDYGNDERIRIGDPDRIISGRHAYDITYRVTGALNDFADHEELVWNLMGAGWPVPADAVSATVDAPAAITRVQCTTGPVGSNQPCAEAQLSGSHATFAQAPVAPGSGVTATIALPKAAVAVAVPTLVDHFTNPSTPGNVLKLDNPFASTGAFAATPLYVSLSAIGLGLVIIGFVWLFRRYGRDQQYAGAPTDITFGNVDGHEEPVPFFRGDPIPVEYVPPENLRPGEMGTLVDQVANPLDVSATIVDLAVRGYLTITEIPKHGMFGKTDWTLTKKKDGLDLKAYERVLLIALFRDGDEVQLSALRNSFATRMNDVQNALYDDAVQQGWFSRRPDKTRSKWHGIGAGVVALGVLCVYLIATGSHAGLVPVPLVIGGILFVFASKWMPRRTAKGTGVVRRALGFRRFIVESEKSRAQFAEKQDLFTEYMPYAIVFGATAKWAKAFAGLANQPPDTSWYVGAAPFDYMALSSAVSGFSLMTSGTLTSTPAGSSSGFGGSSGFSGGGFSGGGMGGGGGGSW
jgi:uncharacterized membrane protein YgcG